MILSRKNREQAIEAIINEKLNPKIEQIREEFMCILEHTAERMYPKHVQDWLDNAPEGGVHLRSHFGLKMHSGDIVKHPLLDRFRFEGGLKKPMRVLAVHVNLDVLQMNEADSVTAVTLLKKLHEINEEITTIQTVVKRALQSCNTRKQVQEHYPDLVKYLPKIQPVTKGLAINNDHVRKVLTGI